MFLLLLHKLTTYRCNRKCCHTEPLSFPCAVSRFSGEIYVLSLPPGPLASASASLQIHEACTWIEAPSTIINKSSSAPINDHMVVYKLTAGVDTRVTIIHLHVFKLVGIV